MPCVRAIMSRSCGSIVVSAASLLLAVSTTPAEELQSQSCGYTLTIPDDWEQIPDDVLQKMINTLTAKGPQQIVMDMAFQPKGAPRWFAYPYAMVQILPYKDQGMSGEPPESALPKMLKEIAGVDVREIKKGLSAEGNKLLGGLKQGVASLDAANHRARYTGDMTVTGIGPIHMVCDVFFGREAFVQVLFYTRPADTSRYDAVRSAIADSFRFDSAHAYDPAVATGGSSSVLGAGARGALIGAVAGAIAPLLLWARKRLARKKE